MYIKVFESRESKRSYTLEQPTKLFGSTFNALMNENHEIVTFTENELFHILDKLFKGKQYDNAP